MYAAGQYINKMILQFSFLNSFGTIVDFSPRPRNVPKSTIVTILIKKLAIMLKLLGAVVICNLR